MVIKSRGFQKSDDGLSTRSDNVAKSEIDGSQAWLTLACVFIINATTLGSLKIYGLIFEEIVAQKFYTREQASWPISTASTIQNLAGLLTPLLALKLSWRSIELIQTAMFVGANVGAYYSGNLALDILFLGIVQGLAFSLRYNMNVVINNEYFVKYRATAMGVSLAGSTCGVFALKPIITHVLDTSDHQFRNAYLALAVIMSANLVFNLLIRRPRALVRPDSPDSQRTDESFDISQDENVDDQNNTSGRTPTLATLIGLLKNPSIHCIWIMQTIYFYISRTYTIFIVDYGVDSGFSRDDSRSLLNFWVYGEIAGRLLLGAFVDSRLISLKWNIVVVNILLAMSGFALLKEPSIFTLPGVQNSTNSAAGGSATAAAGQVSNGSMALASGMQQVASSGGGGGSYNFWIFGVCVSLIAALSSLVNMLIVPFAQEYLGKKNVPWAFAIGSFVTSIFLLLRPSLIGLSRDHFKSYDLLILVMSSAPCIFAILFMLMESFLKRHRTSVAIQEYY